MTFFVLALGFSANFAYAQTNAPSNAFYAPETTALTTFANSIAGAAPKIIAAGALLAIGFVVGKIVGRIVEKAAKKIMQKTNLQSISEVHLVEETMGKFDSVHLVSATNKVASLVGKTLRPFKRLNSTKSGYSTLVSSGTKIPVN